MPEQKRRWICHVRLLSNVLPIYDEAYSPYILPPQRLLTFIIFKKKSGSEYPKNTFSNFANRSTVGVLVLHFPSVILFSKLNTMFM